MRIALGSDHAGFNLKSCIEKSLQGSSVITGDFGAKGPENPFDYPDAAFDVGSRVARKEYDLGILVCGTGIGMACTHVIVDTCRPSASPTTVSENASHAKSGS